MAEEKMKILYLMKILLEDTASIYLVGENNFVVANTKVQNIVPYPIDYYFIDNGMSITE